MNLLWFYHPYLLIPIRLVLATIFITSSLSKFREPHTFTTSVAAYNLLPPTWVHLFARTLSWLELTLGLLLLAGWQTRLATLASATY